MAIGRLGRSLGIHLLLASQRLEEGRLRGLDSHLSYRIGLRTFSASESRSVIGVGDAYELPAVPGLGFLKPDQSSLLRFKAAYVSGPPRTVARAGGGRSGSARREALPFVPGEVVSRLEQEQEAASRAAEQVAAAVPAEKRTVFDIAVVAMTGHGPAAHRVWLPPLDVPDTFDQMMPDLAVDPDLGLVSRTWRSRGPLRFPLGTVDMPREQKREVLRADLSGAAGHVAVVGSPRTGKSTMLRAIVTGLALTHTPREVQFYVLDFGGGTFTGLRDLPHIAGIGTRSEPDVVTRIAAEVAGIVDSREQFFRANGVDTIETYRSRRALGEVDDGYGDVFLVVDGWSTIRSDFDELEAELQTLAQRSLTFGVHLVTSATRWMDYRTGVRDILGTRFELKLGDAMDSEIDRKLAANIPTERPGRGIMAAKYHFLGALPRVDGDSNPGSLGSGVQKLVTAVRDAWQGPPGPKLRLLPTLITQEEVRRLAPAASTVLLGINERALAPVGLDVTRDPHLLVFGNGQSGKSALLRTYMSEVTRLHTPETAQLFVVDYRRANLGEFSDEWVADYATNAQTAAELAGGLADFLRDRLPGGDVTPEQLRNRSWWEGKEAFVVVDDYELVATSQGNPLDPLVPLLAQAVDIGLHVAIARRTGGAGRMYDNLVTALRDLAQPGLLLSGDPSEGALVGQLRAVPAVPGPGPDAHARRLQPGAGRLDPVRPRHLAPVSPCSGVRTVRISGAMRAHCCRIGPRWQTKKGRVCRQHSAYPPLSEPGRAAVRLVPGSPAPSGPVQTRGASWGASDGGVLGGVVGGVGSRRRRRRRLVPRAAGVAGAVLAPPALLEADDREDREADQRPGAHVPVPEQVREDGQGGHDQQHDRGGLAAANRALEADLAVVARQEQPGQQVEEHARAEDGEDDGADANDGGGDAEALGDARADARDDPVLGPRHRAAPQRVEEPVERRCRGGSGCRCHGFIVRRGRGSAQVGSTLTRP